MKTATPESENKIETTQKLRITLPTFDENETTEEELRAAMTMEEKEEYRQAEDKARKRRRAMEKERLEKEKISEKEKPFEQIEQEVLENLPSAERKRVVSMQNWLSENGWNYFDKSYEQFIQAVHKKEIIIWENSVKFIKAHKELYKQELQLPKWEDIIEEEYTDFDGTKVKRREIRQKVLDEDHKSNKIVMKALENEEKNGKEMATYDNTFKAILGSFEWEEDQQIKAMQFATWFIWRGIISKEKDNNNSRVFLDSERDKYDTEIRYSGGPDYDGSLVLVQSC